MFFFYFYRNGVLAWNGFKKNCNFVAVFTDFHGFSECDVIVTFYEFLRVCYQFLDYQSSRDLLMKFNPF